MNTKYNWTNKSKINNDFNTENKSQIPLEILPTHTTKKILPPFQNKVNNITRGEFAIVNIF